MQKNGRGVVDDLFILLVSISLIAGVYLFFVMSQFHLNFLRLPYPQEFRENAMYLATNLLLRGENPYALQNLPQFAVTYGIFYNLVVLPFAAIFGSTYTIHRAISAACMFATCGLVFYWLRIEKVRLSLSLLGVLLLYFNAIINGYDILSRPDALGSTIFIASILIAKIGKFSNRSLLISGALSLVGFLTKPYFALGIGYIFVFMFLGKSKKRAITYLFSAGLTFLLCGVIINRFFPGYIISVFFSNYATLEYKMDMLTSQLGKYWYWNFSLVIMCGISIFQLLRAKDWRLLSRDLLWVAIVISSVVLYRLGQTTGTTMTYFTHLLTPFLVILAFKEIEKSKGYLQLLLLALIVVNVCVLGYRMSVRLPSLEQSPRSWEYLEQLTANYSVLNSAIAAHLMYKHGQPVYDNGHSSYYMRGSYLNRDLHFNNLETKRYDLFVKNVAEKIVNQEFDVIMTSTYDFPYISLSVLEKYYEKTEVVPVRMLYNYRWDIEIWRPKLNN